MMVGFLLALAAAVVFVTFLQTLSAYPALPEQVPIHLDWRGVPNGFGPRWMIWLMVAAQIFTACVMAFSAYALAVQSPGTHGTLLGLSITAVCVAALMWRAQMLLIACAKSGGKPVPMRAFWTFFAVWAAVMLMNALLVR